MVDTVAAAAGAVMTRVRLSIHRPATLRIALAVTAIPGLGTLTVIATVTAAVPVIAAVTVASHHLSPESDRLLIIGEKKRKLFYKNITINYFIKLMNNMIKLIDMYIAFSDKVG